MAAKKYKNSRSPIPAATKRQVRIEAGEACLVCRTPCLIEYAHIDGNRDNHDASNLAPLCPNDHTLYDHGRIPKADIIILKEKARGDSEIVIKLKKQLDYVLGAKHIDISGDFGQLKLKYQNMLSDFGDKLIFYQCFIYLIPEFYLDGRGEENRSTIRDLLSIDQSDEQDILEHLIRLNIVEVTGDLISLVSEQDAKTALSELVTAQKIGIEDLINRFLRS